MARADADRDRRLAEALRDNLKRRKAQARGMPAPEEPEPSDATLLPERP